ncbi:tetratricopeptide repeat protein [Shewanella psychrotolerans]|uniref:tetratricopeptide repeat protein n=1 Tax=Shewanella psychrotolerans TaxID=2864206 RepID=UPI001C65A10C|nr:tetratricopeptide repeat protein [Shewanella psychrotolerans]QYK00432.1 tetratricopeptide repeat protein [Shewanella psychrotolerans]
MRIFLYSLLLPSYFFASIALASDSQILSKEVKLIESAPQFYQDMAQTLAFSLAFTSEAEFNRIAEEQGFTNAELEEEMQWLARLYLEPGVGAKNALEKATTILHSLEIIADTPYDVAYLAMLKSRKTAREKQDYQQAIDLYKKGLEQPLIDEDIRTTLLLHNIHYQIGDLYRITLQKNQALDHFNHYRELAYQLKDNYLIAKAEAALGRFYNEDEQFTKALQHYSEAIRLSESLDKPFLSATLSLRLARVYRDLQAWDEALEYAHKAADNFKALNKDNYLSSAMTVIAMVYGEQGLWNQAIDYYLNAQQIDAKRGNLTAQALNYHNLGEAYFNNDQASTGLDFLLKANSLFLQKKSKHYLVYNDLLISQVATSLTNWNMVNSYAAKAFILAKEQDLLEQMIEALRYRTKALKELGDIEKSLNALDQLIDYNEQLSKVHKETQTYNPSSLAEQKLKLQLAQIQSAQKENDKQISQFRLALIITALATFLISLVCFNLWRGKKTANQHLHTIGHKLSQDPVTDLPGYRAFIEELKLKQKTAMIAMLSLTDKHNMDIELGLEPNQRATQQLMTGLNQSLCNHSYLIRPGVVAITLSQTNDYLKVLEELRTIVDDQPLLKETRLHLGILRLPLMNNPDIKFEPTVYFNVLQMLTAGAISLGDEQDYFVSITPLNFAPAAIFSTPLYLHLEKGITRGLVKVESNGNKSLIRWPKWPYNGDNQIGLDDEKL